MNTAYPQPHGPPNQTAPWPDQMLSMDHYGNQSRSGPCLRMGRVGADSGWRCGCDARLSSRPPYGVPQADGMGCCGAGPDSQSDEGALLSQLCSVLKDYEGLEEIDKMLGIPTLAGQVRLCRSEKRVRLDQISHFNGSCAFRLPCLTRTSTWALRIHP